MLFCIKFYTIKFNRWQLFIHYLNKKRQSCYFITDPPVVSPLPNVKHVVGDHVKITCVLTEGNPSSTTVYWTKSGYSGFEQSGSSLVFPNISRTQNGIYSCVAENKYQIGGKGTDKQTFLLDVLCRHLLNLHNYETFVSLSCNKPLTRFTISLFLYKIISLLQKWFFIFIKKTF